MTAPVDPSDERKRNLTDQERNGVLQLLLSVSISGKLPTGAISDTASKFNVSTKTISRIWKRAQNCFDQGMINADVASNIKKKSGRKKLNRIELNEKIQEVPLRQRTTLRSLSAASKIPTMTLYRIMKEGNLKRVSSTVKPTLTDTNKLERLRFALSMLQENSNEFRPMYDTVHVDEKWFYLTKIKKNFYLLPDESAPERSVKSKRFITKVMFMAAVARPRFDPHKKTVFDGKIGLWPFVVQEPAQRSSKNRQKGTLVTKPIEVNRERYVRMIIDNVIPAIKSKWPIGSKSMHITIQQDNAKPHASTNQEEILLAGHSDGWNIDLVCQPPNSPDFNVLDLGFFNAIQSLQHQQSPKDIDELITAVNDAFKSLTAETLNDVFLSLQLALESTLGVNGGNNYSLQHMGKQKLRREGRLPITVHCDPELLKQAKQALLA